MTAWICVAPRTVIACCIPTCLLPSIFYCFLDKEPLKRHPSNTIRSTSKYGDYKTLSTSDKQVENCHVQAKPKMTFFFKVCPYMMYYALFFFITNLILNSVLTTMTFNDAPFGVPDHFLYYFLIYNIGRGIGGVELLVASSICPQRMEMFKIRRIWLIILILDGILVVFVSSSWYHFLPSVYIVLVLCFILAIVDGCGTVNTLVGSADVFDNIPDKATALSFVELGGPIGTLIAVLLGLVIEGYIREHCTNRLLPGRFCFARAQSTLQWNNNVNCKNT